MYPLKGTFHENRQFSMNRYEILTESSFRRLNNVREIRFWIFLFYGENKAGKGSHFRMI